MTDDIVKNFKKIYLNILNFCKKINHNPLKIKIVAVSKGHDRIKVEKLIKKPHFYFGENRLQETIDKWSYIKKEKIKLHYLGALQSKKVNQICNIFNVIETLDSESAANKIARFVSNNTEKIKPQIFIQVNIGGEKQKRGIPIAEFSDFLKMCKEKYNLYINGAMCIPPNDNKSSKYFKLMNIICKKNKLNDISMGMSKDYLKAIEYGSTNIRIGTEIFGKRIK